MPVLTRLAATPDVAVLESFCVGAAGGPDQPERVDGFELVVPRAGGFRRATHDGERAVDPTAAYLAVPGEDQLITHSADGGGDACRVFALSSGLAPLRLAGGPVALGTAADLFERALIARLRRGLADELAVEEGVVRLCALLDPSDHCPRPTPAVDRARELLAHRFAEPLPLVELARLVGYSPHHLSRTFARATGLTLSRYRRRLRVRAALARLEQGADDLAALAADLGFADHSHLTAACKAETAAVPSRLRSLLAP
jgi:AraC-like DNA-binding protein